MIGYEGDKYVFYFWFVGWDCLSLGFHVCLSAPNVEIHIPFGFIRIGKHKNIRPWRGQGWQFRRNVNMGSY